MSQQRKDELAEWGEAALRQLRGPILTNLKDKLHRWRDPRARLLRRRKAAKAATTGGAVATGTFGLGSFASFSPQLFDLQTQLPPDSAMVLGASGFGLGGLAVATGIGTIGLGSRYRKLKRMPLPDPPPEPVSLPPEGSQAREPMRRLRDAEQSLHESLTRLSAAGVHAPGDALTDTRSTADGAAAALRQLAARLEAVESAVPHAPKSERETLHEDVRRLRAELDEGVEGYGSLVAAASRAVAATGATEQKDLLQDATDRLAGLASALREMSGMSSSTSGGTSLSSGGTSDAAQAPFSTESDPAPQPAQPDTRRSRRGERN